MHVYLSPASSPRIHDRTSHSIESYFALRHIGVVCALPCPLECRTLPTVENNAVQPDAADTKSNSQILRVLSYNIHHAAGTDGKLDLQRIANVIQSVDPDVISLQEVDRLARRSGSVDQPSELARLTGMRVCFAENIPLQGGSYGNAILTRFPIDSYSHALLPNHAKGEQRGCSAHDYIGRKLASLR